MFHPDLDQQHCLTPDLFQVPNLFNSVAALCTGREGVDWNQFHRHQKCCFLCLFLFLTTIPTV
jgi:hypothetical protein